jgi:hypothetical protein
MLLMSLNGCIVLVRIPGISQMRTGTGERELQWRDS